MVVHQSPVLEVHKKLQFDFSSSLHIRSVSVAIAVTPIALKYMIKLRLAIAE